MCSFRPPASPSTQLMRAGREPIPAWRALTPPTPPTAPGGVGGTRVAPPAMTRAAADDDSVPAPRPPAPTRPGPRPLPGSLAVLDISPAAPPAPGGILRAHPGGAGPRAPRRQVQFQLGSEPSLGPNWAGELQPEAPGSPPALPLSQSSMGMCTAPGTLAAPELNTSLALAQEARAVKQQPFNSQHAAHKLLAQSFSTRCALEGRAGAAMNIPRQQQLYQGLLSLEVPASEVLNWALQEKLALVRPRPEPPRDLAPDGPDPRMFFEPQQLLTETPHLGPEGLGPLPLPQPHIRPLSAVFLMYRKFQQWDL